MVAVRLNAPHVTHARGSCLARLASVTRHQRACPPTASLEQGRTIHTHRKTYTSFWKRSPCHSSPHSQAQCRHCAHCGCVPSSLLLVNKRFESPTISTRLHINPVLRKLLQELPPRTSSDYVPSPSSKSASANACAPSGIHIHLHILADANIQTQTHTHTHTKTQKQLACITYCPVAAASAANARVLVMCTARPNCARNNPTMKPRRHYQDACTAMMQRFRSALKMR